MSRKKPLVDISDIITHVIVGLVLRLMDYWL